MGKRCDKGKPCGATCIERVDACLKDAGDPITQSLRTVRDSLQANSATYKINKSATPAALAKAGVNTYEAQSMRKNQLQAKRILNGLRGENPIKTDGLAEESAINWRSLLGSGIRSVGNGEFGSFSTIPSDRLLPNAKDSGKVPPTVGVKTGKIGPNEARALRIVGENDLGPQLIGARVSPDVKPGKGGIEGSNGVVAMTIVPGLRYVTSPDSINGFPKSEMYWEAIASLHKLGIAHNDLHSGNVIIDVSGRPPKARIIDFGLAQLSSKAALAEALGSLNDGNFQFSASKRKGHALTFRANLPYIEQLLMDKGFSKSEIMVILRGGIRKKDKFFNTGPWAKLTEEEAKGLIDDLYAGIVD